MKDIKHECQLMERCDGHNYRGGGRECMRVRQFSGRCDSSQGGVKVVRNLVQLMKNCDDHGGGEQGLWEV